MKTRKSDHIIFVVFFQVKHGMTDIFHVNGAGEVGRLFAHYILTAKRVNLNVLCQNQGTNPNAILIIPIVIGCSGWMMTTLTVGIMKLLHGCT